MDRNRNAGSGWRVVPVSRVRLILAGMCFGVPVGMALQLLIQGIF